MQINIDKWVSDLDYLNNGGQGELREANRVGLSVKVLKHQVIQLVNQPILELQKKRYYICA